MPPELTGRPVYSPPLPMPEYTPEQVEREVLRAEMCAVATRHCFRHGTQVVDDILANFHVTRKSLKEKRR